MKRKFLLSFCFSIFYISTGYPHGGEHCHEVRAAFDIGSGSTRMLVAKVDKCHQQVLEVLHEESVPVPYKESLEQSGKKNEIDPATIEQGVALLQKLVEKAQSFHPTGMRGVATAAFRQARNGLSFMQKIYADTKIKVQVISQKQEASIGFLSLTLGKDGYKFQLGKPYVVWDIGAGSMQLVTLHQGQQFDIYQGHLASINFRNKVIQEKETRQRQQITLWQKIKNKIHDLLYGPKTPTATTTATVTATASATSSPSPSPLLTRTPNPLGADLAIWSWDWARAFALQSIPAGLQEVIRQQDYSVIGIGGVHYFSIKGQIENFYSKKIKDYTLDQVRETLITRCEWTDQKIGGPYANTDITNLALVGGMMEGLGIHQVTPLQINMTTGVILFEEFW